MGVWRREPPPRSPSPSRLLLAALVLLARHLQSETFELLPGTEEEVLLKAQGLPSGGGEAAAAAEEASPCEDEDEQCDDWAADGRCGELPDKCRVRDLFSSHPRPARRPVPPSLPFRGAEGREVQGAGRVD